MISTHSLTNSLTHTCPPTYTARPVNGGPLEKALPKSGQWFYEPKYNGWRALVHIATGSMFNRKGEPLSIAGEFKPALDAMRTTLDCEAYKWADCEALERRHGIGKGCLVVLDAVPEPEFATAPYVERRGWLWSVIEEMNLMPERCAGGKVPLLSIPPHVYGTDHVWRDIQEINRRLGCEFYEGLVAKRADSIYPIQLRSPDLEFPYWQKHRWKF